jgi:hypothetical protein
MKHYKLISFLINTYNIHANSKYISLNIIFNNKITKLQAAIKYGEEDLPGAKVGYIIYFVS